LFAGASAAANPSLHHAAVVDLSVEQRRRFSMVRVSFQSHLTALPPGFQHARFVWQDYFFLTNDRFGRSSVHTVPANVGGVVRVSRGTTSVFCMVSHKAWEKPTYASVNACLRNLAAGMIQYNTPKVVIPIKTFSPHIRVIDLVGMIEQILKDVRCEIILYKTAGFDDENLFPAI